MTDLALSAATIAALRARHIAFLAERLTDDRAKGDFIRSFAAGWEHVLATPLAKLLEPRALADGVARIATADAVRGLFSPVAREIDRRVTASLRSDDARLGDYVPPAARQAIDELLARPDLVPEDLVRRIFEDEAVEEIMRDVLYDALVEFNSTVNPFFADWGLPALIKRFVPIGSGAVLKSMSAVRGEFDKRLEPEIRKFMLVFSRKSKSRVADFVIAHAGDPKLVALRQSVVAFFYGETLASLTKNIDDDARLSTDEAREAILLELLARDRPRERLIAAIEDLLREHGEEPIGAWLERIGVRETPNLEAIAELLWPFVRFALESPPARAFYERVTWDFYASLGDARP